MSKFYVVDLRPEWRCKPYITVWRPNACGYAYPLSWGGLYSKAEIDGQPDYYTKKGDSGRYIRFAVPAVAAQWLAVAPAPRQIDGDAGPVLPNTAEVRSALRRARYLPETSPIIFARAA